MESRSQKAWIGGGKEFSAWLCIYTPPPHIEQKKHIGFFWGSLVMTTNNDY